MGQRFAVFDIEAIDWSHFRLGVFLVEDGVPERFSSIDALRERIERHPGRVFAHYGGGYDFLFFGSALRDVIVTGSRVLSARLGRAKLWDSFSLMPATLAKLGAWTRTQKDTKVDRSKIETLTDAECEAYCAQDCQVLVEALQSQRAWVARTASGRPRWPATSGGTATYLAEALEPLAERLASQCPDLEELRKQFACVAGGRVEIFQVGQVENVHVYDVNSSYPFAWVEAPVPLGPWTPTLTEKPRFPGVYFCKIQQPTDSGPVPVVCDYAYRRSGEGWLTSEEIAYARAEGAKIETQFGWWTPCELDCFGARFTEILYRAKQRGDPWAKLCLNSLHGKFSQKLERESYEWAGSEYEAHCTLSLPRWFQRPLTGAFVLARARLRLAKAMRALVTCGRRVYYCDTDCVHTDCPPEAVPFEVGTRLGEWKHEASGTVCYVAPKVYGIQGADGVTKLVCKGVPHRLVTWDDILAVAKGEHRSYSAASGLKGFLSAPGQGAIGAVLKRTLKVNTGGKKHGVAGRLFYD